MGQHSASARILLAGLSPEFYTSLKCVASRAGDVERVITAPSLEAALDTCADTSPDVLLLEVPVPKPHLYKRVQDLSGHPGHPAVVAVSQVEDDEVLYHALSIGATALVTLDTPPEFIMSAIHRTRKGERPIEYAIYARAGVARHLMQEMWELRLPAPVQQDYRPLSKRELDILSSIARGCANKEIASIMGLKEQTVKNYVSGILRKMDAYDRVQAVVLALRNKWISLDYVASRASPSAQ